MICIEKLESPQVMRVCSARIGAYIPLYAGAVGKAYLAGLDDAERNRLLGLIKPGQTDVAALRTELSLAQQYGFTESNDETDTQVFCVSTAIRNNVGLPVACISISVPVFRKPDRLQDSLINPLLTTCKLIAQKLPGPLRQETRVSQA